MTTGSWILGGVGVLGVLYFAGVRRFVRCPTNRLLLTYNRFDRWINGGDVSVNTYRGGVTYVPPVIQAYRMLDLTPLTVEVNLESVAPDEYVLVPPTTYYVRVGLDVRSPDQLQTAVERYKSSKRGDIRDDVKGLNAKTAREVMSEFDNEFLNEERHLFLLDWQQRLGERIQPFGIELLSLSHKTS